MNQSLFFPLAIETARLHTELFAYNPFTVDARQMAGSLKPPAVPAIEYVVELRRHNGAIAAITGRRRLEPLGICRLWLRDLVEVPFVGSARIDCLLSESAFAPSARRYLQTRANIYADSTCIITDHGRQSAAGDEEVVYGEMSIDAETETAIFLTHPGTRQDIARPTLRVRGSAGREQSISLAPIHPGSSTMFLVGSMFPDFRGDGIVTVMEPSRGLLTGYHFKLARSLQPEFSTPATSGHDADANADR